MWNLFKIVNFFWLLASTRMWPTALFNLGPILIPVNLLMLLCISMLPIKVRLDARTGLVMAAILMISLWYIWIDGAVMGVVIFLQYLPVLFLLQLPAEYMKDLLRFSTKWLAILLIPAILLYWALLFVDLPSFGQFVHPTYKPFLNYIFYIKTTFDYGTFERFNAFFLEPGHLALLCTFLLIANKYQFRKNKWLIVLVVCIAFSFSLAGYLLATLGFILLKINSIGRTLVALAAVAVIAVAAVNFLGEDTAMYELIVSRLEYDESKGIKGNNRVDSNTDYVFDRAVHKGKTLTGVSKTTNMDLVAGAGYKIYIIRYGLVGAILSLALYVLLIPPAPDWRYTLIFLFILILCFMQRAYPEWYSWLFPYISGTYLAKAEKDGAFVKNKPDYGNE